MASTSFKVKKSLNLEPAASPTLDTQGDMGFDSTSDTLQVRHSAATRSMVSADGTQTLTNKTIDADNNTITNIKNADIKAAAAIARTKLASGTASHVLINDGSGVMSSEAQLDKTRGGTGITSTATFPASGTITTDAGTSTFTNKTFDADGTGNSITNIENADIKAAAAIALDKLAATTASRALVSDASGFVSAATTTSTEIGYVNGVTSAIQTQLDAKVAKSTFTTKGDLLVTTAASTITRLGVGSNNTVLTADSGEASGVKWASVGNSLAVSTKTTTYSATTSDDLLLADATGGAFTITLPAAASSTGKVLRFKKIDSSSNALTVDGNGAETIDGAASFLVPTQYEQLTVVCNGTSWNVLGPRPRVAARYSTNAGQNISNAAADAIIDFEDVDYDTHSAVTTGASWKFTVPAGQGGVYRVSAQVAFASGGGWAAGELATILLYKNGSASHYLSYYHQHATHTTTVHLVGSQTISLAAADYIDLRIFQNSGTNPLALNTSVLPSISIERIGD